MSFSVENYFPDHLRENIILYYKGSVDSNAINCVLDSVEKKMVETNDNVKLRKKVYNVLVESLQNLYHHVDEAPEDFSERADKFGIFQMEKIDGGYKIITGNFVHSDNIESLEGKLRKINRSTQEEIRELYKFILNHQRISAKGGGGLGLVDIARKTGNKLDYSFVKYNEEYSFFYLNILIKEEEN